MSNKESFNSVYISIRRTLTQAVSRMVPPKEIEDIVQETYVRVCQVDNKEEIQYLRSFMLKTARNLALDHLKNAGTRLSVGMDEDLELEFIEKNRPVDQTYNSVAANREFVHFCEAVRDLPLQCRKVFVMKKVYGFSQKEIAKNLNLSESTVEKHIANGLKRCLRFMSSTGSTHHVSARKKTASSLADGGGEV